MRTFLLIILLFSLPAFADPSESIVCESHEWNMRTVVHGDCSDCAFTVAGPMSWSGPVSIHHGEISKDAVTGKLTTMEDSYIWEAKQAEDLNGGKTGIDLTKVRYVDVFAVDITLINAQYFVVRAMDAQKNLLGSYLIDNKEVSACE